MKIVLELDDGTKEIHQNVTDYYLAVRKLEPMIGSENDMATLPETRSFSYGSNLREVAKEVAQSLVEIQEFLREQRRGLNS